MRGMDSSYSDYIDPFEIEAEAQAAVEKAALKESQERDDWLKIASSPEGRRVLRGLMSYCRVGQSVWQPDEAQLHFACGKQAAGLEIVNKVREHAPEFLPHLLKEDE